jgi:TonB-linked SusC/RagA family outer membrane protein
MKKVCRGITLSSLKLSYKILLIMKVSFLIMFIATLNVSAALYSQDAKLSVAVNDKSLIDVIRIIEKQSNYRFFFSDNYQDLNSLVTINAKDKNINELLSNLLQNRAITYKVLDNKIVVITPKDKPVQQQIVTGLVTDATTNEPLPGVNIVVEGTTIGAVTDMDGKYSIEVPFSKAILMFTYIGYNTERVEAAGRNVIDIKLIPDIKKLEEVVVVGYTTQKKETITGSIATITTRDLKQSPTANISNALAGRMPGLMVNQFSGGEPGVDRSDVYVRGYATYGTKSPIVIVDGVERSMNNLASEEIESFTILKDASATAQYGVRGANGVIIITTKRGKVQDKATVNLKASYGVNQSVKFPEYLGSADYAMLYNEAMTNDLKAKGGDPANVKFFTDEAIENFRKAKGDNSDGLGYNWDYFDYAFKPGAQQDYSLSIRGGSNRARYYVMANYFEQSGNYDHTELGQYKTQAIYKRYNFRSNVDIDITNNFYAKLDIGARITDRNAPGTTANRIVEFCNTQPSYLPIIVESNDNPGNATYEANNPKGMLYGDQIYRFNILGELNRTGFLDEKNTYVDGSFTLGHKLDFITEGLKVDATFSYDASEGHWVNRKIDTYTEGYREYPSYATFVPDVGRDIYMTPGHYTGLYKTGNKYNIDQTMGSSGSRNETIGRTYFQVKLDYARKFGEHAVGMMVLGNRSKKDRMDSDSKADVPYCYQGLTGRMTYNFGDRYLFEFNAGYNGSENFSKGNRYGFFPAVSAGWILSNESFMSGTKQWLDNFKIRGSYGLVGSDQMSSGRFSYLQYYSGGSDYSFGDANFGSGAGGGINESSLANPKLSWEKAEKTNIGIDASFLGGRLTLVTDYFFEHRYDIITSLSDGDKLGYPDVVGKDAPIINSGVVDNHGFDFEIGWNSRIGKDFRYYIKPNFSFARNKIKFMNEIPYEYPWRAKTGKRIDEHFVYVFDHFVRDDTEAATLNQMNEGAGFQPWGTLIAGDVVYKDLNGDGKIESNGDRKSMGDPRTPEIMFGIPLGVQYKGFDFSMTFQGATNTSLLLNGAAVWDFPLYGQDKFGKVKKMHLNRWTPETANTASYPALHYGDHSNNKNENSSLFLYDASYLRLKTVELGYNVPQKVLKYLKLQQVRIYCQGLNLFTWDGLDDVDIDPETREGSGDWYPIQKVYNFGIDVTF